MIHKKIGIDLGTCYSVVFLPKKGVVLYEPSVVAVNIPENKKEMLGRTPDNIKVYRPLKDGVIADYRVTQAMLRYFIKKSLKKLSFLKPELLVGVPAGITSTEKRAVIEAGLTAGAKAVYLAKEPVLAAIGAGGGTTEVAVISLGGVVTSHSLRVGGDKIDLAISEYIKKKYNLAIGDQTAEEIKIKIGTALPLKKIEYLEIKGRDLISGLPRTIKISSNEIAEAISDILKDIVQVIKFVLRETPPELSADIMNKGIVISGGGALLRNIETLISQMTGVPCFIAEDPLLCVAKGTGVVLENLEVYKKSIMSKK